MDKVKNVKMTKGEWEALRQISDVERGLVATLLQTVKTLEESKRLFWSKFRERVGAPRNAGLSGDTNTGFVSWMEPEAEEK